MVNKTLQFRDGTTAQHATFTGAAAELSVDTSNNSLVVHDGSTAGGFEAARKDFVNVLSSTKDTWVDSGGTADAITATYSPAITLVDGQIAFVRAGFANATTTPTFAPNGLTAHTIVKAGGTALAAGDIAGNGHELILRYDLTGTRWELLNPDPANAGGGKVAQVVVTTDGTAVSTTSTFPYDNTIPQNTEGAEFTQVATTITPTNASSTLIIEWSTQTWANSPDKLLLTAIFKDAIADAIGAATGLSTTNGYGSEISGIVSLSAGSTSAQTFKMRYGPASAITMHINGDGGSRFGGTLATTLKITEILP